MSVCLRGDTVPADLGLRVPGPSPEKVVVPPSLPAAAWKASSSAQLLPGQPSPTVVVASVAVADVVLSDADLQSIADAGSRSARSSVAPSRGSVEADVGSGQQPQPLQGGGAGVGGADGVDDEDGGSGAGSRAVCGGTGSDQRESILDAVSDVGETMDPSSLVSVRGCLVYTATCLVLLSSVSRVTCVFVL